MNAHAGWIWMLVSIVILTASPPVWPGGRAIAVRETVEYLVQKFGPDAFRVSRSALTSRLGAMAARHGDQVLEAVRRGGPPVLVALEEAGPKAPQLLRWLAEHGDGAIALMSRPQATALALQHGEVAAKALVRHGPTAEPVIERLGASGARALETLDPQNGRRLAMLLEDGTLKQIGHSEKLLEVVTRHGDKAMDFVWRNKGALLVTAALVAFLAAPEPFIHGVRDLASIAGQTAAKPVAEGVKESVQQMNWTLLAIVTLTLIAGILLLRRRTRNSE